METEPRTHLLAWLADAYAMEQQAETLLVSQIAQLRQYPDLRNKLEEHLRVTRRQGKLIADCIQSNGGDTSAVKGSISKPVAVSQGLSALFVDDEVIKGVLSSYTFKQMEIASYTVLIEAARVCGDSTTAAICSRILREQVAMATWLATVVPNLVRAFLQLEQTRGVAAKR